LTQVTLPGSGGSVTFKYDPFGRRIEKVSSSAISIFAYDGDNLIEEVNATGTVVARYTEGQNIDEPLAMSRSGATSYYEADGLGSVTSLTSGAGAVAQTYTFDSFGKQTGSSGSLTNPFQYTARESDPETGLYYYRARYYDPTAGRFLSEDPTDFGAGPNFYQYVLNNPVGLNDPSGTNPGVLPWPVLVGGGAGVGEGIAIGGAVGGAAVGGWLVGRAIGHIPIGGSSTVDDAVTNGWLWLILLAERTIPKPAKPKCGCTCTCRADANDEIVGNVKPGLPRFAFGTATASSCFQASKDAKRIATQNLGMIPKHLPCKCAGN
jgi:RHS repeat-associated protein